MDTPANPWSSSTETNGALLRSADTLDEDGFEDAVEPSHFDEDFTLRAVVVGLLVGVILCMTNIYFGLQTGGSLCSV
jgi:hypothetical protein